MDSRVSSRIALILIVSALFLLPGHAYAGGFLFNDPEFSFQVLRAVGQAPGGAPMSETC